MRETNLVLNFVIFLSISTSIFPTINSASMDEVKTLRANLLSGYDKYVRPVRNQTDIVNVHVGLSMIALQEFDEVLEKFSFVGVFFLSWTDENLVWDSANYSGIEEVFIGYKDVWVPEIILTNPSEKLDSFGEEWQLLRYNAIGGAFWFPGNLIKATCAINAYYFPFDVQECTLEVYAWGYYSHEVRLVAARDVIDTNMMPEHGSWSIIQTQVKVENVSSVSKASFVFRFERKPQYVIVNVVLPILFLCLLNVLVFLLPPESGERISYSITVLLSIAVFMTIVSDTLPKTSEPLPIISFFMMMSLIASSLITTAAILNLRLFHKSSDTTVPNWLVSIYRRLGSCCSNKCKRKRGSISAAKEKGISTPVTEIKLGSSNKEAVLEPPFQDIVNNVSVDTPVSWQEISVFLDYLLLIVSTSFTVISFCIFLIITGASAK